jgi:putative hydrolases of HD superfamily
MDRLARQLGFTAEAGRLKGVLRQTVLTDPRRRENSAEHSWHVAIMALALAEHAPAGVDIGTVIRMLVLHDLVEIDAGDLFVYAPEAEQARQQAAEHAAAERIFALLPDDQATELRRLWLEFEERRTAEARFARAIDRLQPMLENVRIGGGTWRAQAVTADQVLAKVRLIEDGSAALGHFARRLVQQAVRDGILAPPRSEEQQLDDRDDADARDQQPQG